MDDASKKILSKNIEDKLDEFFSDDDVEEPSTSPANIQPSLEKLKSMVLSIDWEITDECLKGLVTETENLIAVYEDDRPTNALLRMLKALGNYIRKHKAQAHQEAIKRVMSVFASLETIIDGHIIDESEKKKGCCVRNQSIQYSKGTSWGKTFVFPTSFKEWYQKSIGEI